MTGRRRHEVEAIVLENATGMHVAHCRCGDDFPAATREEAIEQCEDHVDTESATLR